MMCIAVLLAERWTARSMKSGNLLVVRCQFLRFSCFYRIHIFESTVA